MTDDEKGYNGWTNYETWSVALIVDNDQRTYNGRRDLVAETVEQADTEAHEHWTPEETRKFRVADALKEWITDAAEETLETSEAEPLSFLWSQLVSAALSDVNWEEIAENWLVEYNEEVQTDA